VPRSAQPHVDTQVRTIFDQADARLLRAFELRVTDVTLDQTIVGLALDGVKIGATGAPSPTRRWPGWVPPGRTSSTAADGFEAARCRCTGGWRRRASTARAPSRCWSGWKGKLFVLTLLGFAATETGVAVMPHGMATGSARLVGAVEGRPAHATWPGS
jgi:hypothetical protein